MSTVKLLLNLIMSLLKGALSNKNQKRINTIGMRNSTTYTIRISPKILSQETKAVLVRIQMIMKTIRLMIVREPTIQ